MEYKTARELVNYLNTNYITPFTVAYVGHLNALTPVVRINVTDNEGDLLWIAEWSEASHRSFRAMLYNMKCTPYNLGR